MTWLLLLAGFAVLSVFATAAWILLVGWLPRDAEPNDRLERLRRVEKS